ncbi:MAG: hypothetical protein ACRDV9_08375 [Acidimicrobiia bacterium]
MAAIGGSRRRSRRPVWEGLSVNAFAVRELREVARRADHPALLADLPDLGLSADEVLGDLESGRATR